MKLYQPFWLENKFSSLPTVLPNEEISKNLDSKNLTENQNMPLKVDFVVYFWYKRLVVIPAGLGTIPRNETPEITAYFKDLFGQCIQ